MASTSQTAARLSRRAALLMLLQTMVASVAASQAGAGGGAIAGQAPTPVEIPIWPQIDAQAYRLQVAGLVATPLSLTYNELQSLPKTQAERVLLCMGEYFHDKATWSGVRLDQVLDPAAPQVGATTITLRGADGYEQTVPLPEAASYLLAQERAGQPLAEKHGFPLRAVWTTDEGWKWVKWLVEIRVS